MLNSGIFPSQRGQALLIIVLIMVVALTVGLSIATRSITSLRTSTEEANSAQALSAAEAGLERSLTSGQIASETFLNNQAKYSTTVNTIGGNKFLLNDGILVSQDEGIDLWFVNHTCGTDGKSACWNSPWTGNINIYWDTNSCNTSAALEIAIISGSVTSPSLTRYAYDPCDSDPGGGRRTSNEFLVPQAGGTIQDKVLNYSTGDITVTNGLIARIIPIYNNTVIGISANSSLPSQGTLVTATGSFGEGINKIVRKLTAFQVYPSLPEEYFTFGIFSPVSK